ncbi:MAG: hypothetical protein KC486_09925 [Myxococcales bacterium]|nr:hypothetical protein [Myxococcales bacterium]
MPRAPTLALLGLSIAALAGCRTHSDADATADAARPAAPATPASTPAPRPEAPNEAAAPRSSAKIVDVAAGFHLFCVVVDDGTVQCGDPSLREEGWVPARGDLHSEGPKRRSDAFGAGPEAPTQLALAEDFICALRADASVRCWKYGMPSFPMDLLAGETALQLDAGRGHVCAALRSGRVACWGLNNDGQIGDGSRELRPDAVLVAGIDDAVEVAAGAHHSCARHRSGDVSCWGSNDHGQLARDGRRQLEPVKIAGIAGATAIAAGQSANQTCAVVEGGQVACWGSWGCRECVEETTRIRPAPTILSGVRGAAEVAVNTFQVCARVDAELRCWSPEFVADPIYGEPTSPLGGDVTVRRIAAGNARIYAQSADDQLLVINRATGGSEPIGAFTIDAALSPTE